MLKIRVVALAPDPSQFHNDCHLHVHHGLFWPRSVFHYYIEIFELSLWKFFSMFLYQIPMFTTMRQGVKPNISISQPGLMHMFAYLHGWVFVWMTVCMDNLCVWLCAWLYAWMAACMDCWVHGCMLTQDQNQKFSWFSNSTFAVCAENACSNPHTYTWPYIQPSTHT